jgi:choline dehydrogenase-like flavoprotein
MGNDPKRSVVDPDYRVRGVEGLSIVDGSVVPGPLGVNSQLTVMAFAHRAAGILHRQLEEEEER